MTNSIVWYENTVKGDSVNQVAKKSGISQSTLNLQLTRKGALSPESAVAIARAYGASILEALIATGLVTPDEAASFKSVDIDSLVPSVLERATESQISSEFTRRLTLLAQIQAARREKTEK